MKATITHRSIKIQHEASFKIFFCRLAATPITSWSQIRKFGVGVMQNSSFFQFYLTDERFVVQVSVKYRQRNNAFFTINIGALNILFNWFTGKLTAVNSYQVFQKKIKLKQKLTVHSLTPFFQVSTHYCWVKFMWDLQNNEGLYKIACFAGS